MYKKYIRMKEIKVILNIFLLTLQIHYN